MTPIFMDRHHSDGWSYGLGEILPEDDEKQLNLSNVFRVEDRDQFRPGAKGGLCTLVQFHPVETAVPGIRINADNPAIEPIIMPPVPGIEEDLHAVTDLDPVCHAYLRVLPNRINPIPMTMAITPLYAHWICPVIKLPGRMLTPCNTQTVPPRISKPPIMKNIVLIWTLLRILIIQLLMLCLFRYLRLPPSEKPMPRLPRFTLRDIIEHPFRYLKVVEQRSLRTLAPEASAGVETTSLMT